MLVGAYPFEDPEEPKNFRKTIHVRELSSFMVLLVEKKNVIFQYIYSLAKDSVLLLSQRILNVLYAIPDYVHISPECRHLISRIFVADSAKVKLVYFSAYRP